MSTPLPLGLRLPIQGVQLIEASAGTGKTFTVATLYARLVIEFGLPVSAILAVTFTEAATKELREQLRQRLVLARDLLDDPDAAAATADATGDGAGLHATRALLRGALAREGQAALRQRLRLAAAQMDLAPIHTIHGFCQRALAEHALEAGQPLAPRELVQNEAALRREVAFEFWRERSRAPADAQALLSLWGTPDALADALRELLSLDALLPAPPPVDAEAGPALRAARQALAQAFEVHGDSARARLRDACSGGHVHKTVSKDAAVDPVWDALRAWQPEPLDRDPAADKLGNYAQDALARKTNAKGRTPTSPLFDAIGAWCAARARMDAVLAGGRVAMVHAARAFGIARLAALKRERGLIGFDDMIRGVAEALAQPGGGAFARALQAQYRVALVDEFQDTDPRQWAIFRRLFALPVADEPGPPRALLLIGDPKQAIYRFRGGDVATYLAAQAEAGARHPLLHNFRSRPRALHAVEALFTLRGPGAFDQAGIEFEPVQPGGACRDDMLRIDGADAPALVVQLLDLAPGTSADELRDQATAACVLAIHGLLAPDADGRRAELVDRDGVSRAVAPGDISVLVPTNADAARIQQALSLAGIPCVAAGRDSLYDATEARDLCWLLAALLAPADESRLRAALATPLFGLDAAALAALDTDPGAHRHWQDQLSRWLSRARRHGPVALVGDICAAQAPRLLGWPDGERRLSNYLQLAEDLQSDPAALLGPGALLQALEARIAGADNANDAELLRLESDARRVRILTLHVSKGLTLDLVMLPFAATAPSGGRRSAPPMARVHDGLARVGHLYPDKDGAACADEAGELHAEQVRLLYVGLTRARLATWVAWGAGKDSHKSALGWLLHRDMGGGAIGRLDTETVYRRVRDLQARAPAAIAVREPVDVAAVASLPRLRFAAREVLPAARTVRRTLDRDWWVYSFSQLAREDSGAEPRPAEDELEALPPAQRSRFSGTRFGNALHAALETVDFAAWRDWRSALPPGGLPPPGQLEPLARALADAGFSAEADLAEGVPLLAALVGETLNAPMPEGTRLAALPPASRVAEMEFHLSLAPVQVDALLALLHAHGLVDARRGFGLRQRLEGLLTGFIDLVYEADGRYYVLDYKSNQLPAYDAAAVQRAIADGEYDLQYLVYTLALHRWLRFRLGAERYDPRRHLGGVRYLFCRGLDRDDPARPGVHALALPPALVAGVDALLSPPGGTR